jgi:hypothetical protein
VTFFQQLQDDSEGSFDSFSSRCGSILATVYCIIQRSREVSVHPMLWSITRLMYAKQQYLEQASAFFLI